MCSEDGKMLNGVHDAIDDDSSNGAWYINKNSITKA